MKRLQKVVMSIRRDAAGEQGSYPEAQPSETNAPAVSRASGDCGFNSERRRQKQSKREAAMKIGPHDHQRKQTKTRPAIFFRCPSKKGGPDDDDRKCQQVGTGQEVK